MFIRDSLTKEEIDFIMEKSNSEYFKDKLIVFKLREWASLKKYGQEFNDSLLKGKIELLEDYLKINNILSKCIGGFSNFVNFGNNVLKFELNYNFRKEGLPFVGLNDLDFEKFKTLEGTEVPY